MPLPNDEFILLCVRTLSGEGSAAERRRLVRLLRDARHRACYEELRATWKASGEIDGPGFDATRAYARLRDRLAETAGAVSLPFAPLPSVSQRVRPVVPWLAIAAAAVLAVAASLWREPAPPAPPPIRWIERAAPAGRQSVIRLEDGTRVTLNGPSSLFYPTPFGGRRTARLVGEAYFEVAHDPAHPFVLVAGGLRTTVLGTRFDVRALPADQKTSVALVAGRVEVEPLRATGAAASVVLHPGQEFSLERSAGTGRVAAFDPAVALDWMNGAMVFRNEPLATVAARLEHRFGVKVEFADPEIARKTIDARFHRESLAEILQVLSFACGVRCEMLPAGGPVARVRLRANPAGESPP